MSKALKNSLIFLALVISLLMHWEHLDKDLISIHAWRQTQTQATTLSFYEEDMNILRPRRYERGNGEGVFRMEFPLFQWLNALVLKVFGKDIVVTRVFVFLIGSGTVIGMYRFLQAAAKAGARYLYTDSERVIATPAAQLLLDSLVVQLGSVRVYQLKVPIPDLPDGDGG